MTGLRDYSKNVRNLLDATEAQPTGDKGKISKSGQNKGLELDRNCALPGGNKYKNK